MLQEEGGWELPTMKAQKLLQDWNYTVILSSAVKCLSVCSRTLNIPSRYPEQLLLVIDANSVFLSFSPITYSRLSLRCWKYWMSFCCMNFALIFSFKNFVLVIDLHRRTSSLCKKLDVQSENTMRQFPLFLPSVLPFWNTWDFSATSDSDNIKSVESVLQWLSW